MSVCQKSNPRPWAPPSDPWSLSSKAPRQKRKSRSESDGDLRVENVDIAVHLQTFLLDPSADRDSRDISIYPHLPATHSPSPIRPRSRGHNGNLHPFPTAADRGALQE
ncbi:hypothetical protein M440DRAFT_1390006 [Trichoderma longibrachiatum ATCC 18648]|uniref:Uncharacterized protein n=1 Tax=Trichoderma longibrachiatum ATCC 18648 TaxID=983965 RepID=A0A2T4C9U6_TRILO|nr:hypothetical protein M440DRAFT_1390006 [Trichoderma longibrachiatum ATCC 18648]